MRIHVFKWCSSWLMMRFKSKFVYEFPKKFPRKFPRKALCHVAVSHLRTVPYLSCLLYRGREDLKWNKITWIMEIHYGDIWYTCIYKETFDCPMLQWFINHRAILGSTHWTTHEPGHHCCLETHLLIDFIGPMSKEIVIENVSGLGMCYSCKIIRTGFAGRVFSLFCISLISSIQKQGHSKCVSCTANHYPTLLSPCWIHYL